MAEVMVVDELTSVASSVALPVVLVAESVWVFLEFGMKALSEVPMLLPAPVETALDMFVGFRSIF